MKETYEYILWAKGKQFVMLIRRHHINHCHLKG